jgi:tRNA-dihydrouridine synthase
MKWRIREVEFDNQVVIAPMAGVTNPAFRTIVKEFGAGLVYSEMISDKGLGHNNAKTHEMLFVDPSERPLSLQIFGGEAETLIPAAILVDQHDRRGHHRHQYGLPRAESHERRCRFETDAGPSKSV